MVRRIIAAIAANLFGQVGNLVIQLLGVPIFLSFWGVEYYGEWLILFTIPGFFGMSDLGLGTVAINEICMNVSNDKKEDALSVFQSIWVFISLVTLFLFLCAIILVSNFPLDDWMNIKLISGVNFQYSIIFLLLYSMISMQFGLLNGIYRSEGAYAKGQFLANLLRLIEFGVVLFLIVLGFKALLIACTFLFIRSFGLLLIGIDIINRYKWFSIGYSSANISTVLRLLKPSLYFLAFPLSNAIIIQGMITAVGSILGSVAVVAFSTTRTLVNLIKQIMGVINNSTWAEFSILLGKGDKLLAKKLHRRAVQFSFWLSLVAIIFLFFFGEIILEIWTQGNVKVDELFFILMLLSVAANTMWYTSIIVPISINQHNRIAKFYFISTIISFFIAIILMESLGIISVPIGLLIIDLIMIPIVFKNSFEILGETFPSFIKLGVFNFKQ
ncbi:lipopolysaccharide biosynthesis protein [bacterium]|nr:lipopolysaccharide biosynthesis protein [bacterium]